MFSIVVPTKDRPVQLRRLLESFTSLEPPEGGFEVIVVNDGGQPITEVVEPYARSLNVQLINIENTGPASARNAGVRRSAGIYVAFVDDDCRVTPGWLSAYERAFAHSPQALLGGKVINGRPDSLPAVAAQLILDAAYAFYNRVPERARFFASMNMAVPRETFLELGGFNQSFQAASEDRELCERWLAHGLQLRYVPEAIVIHDQDLTVWGFLKRYFRYGVGAASYHQARRQLRSSQWIDHTGFYRSLLPVLFRHVKAHPKKVRLLALLATWQAANTIGFIYGNCQRLARPPGSNRPNPGPPAHASHQQQPEDPQRFPPT